MLFLTCFIIGLTGILFAVAFGMASRPVKVSYVERLKKAQAGVDASGAGLRDAEVMDKSLLQRVILPMAEKYGKLFKGITPATMIEQCEQTIAEAGMQNSISGVQLTTLSWILAAGLPLGIGFLFMPHVVKGMISPMMFLGICAVCMILGYRLPRGIIQGKAKQRKHQIQLALPFTFDLISISVEAGMAFDGAIAVVAERTKGPLSDELRRTLREINLGVSRPEALTNLSRRTGVDDLRSFITAVNYISKLGGSLVEVIKIQTEAMRVKRRQKAEEKANQAPVKIMIPLVLFIFPCLFIVILGPAGLLLFSGGAGI
jgi:tight adherence protein C